MFDLNNYFDCIYCINLPHRTDRLQTFKKNNFAILGTNNICIYPAVNGKDVKEPDWPYSLGALGCRLSHLAIYRDALTKKYSKILVLEDDAVLNKNLKKKLTCLLDFVKDDWDMIYLGGTHYLEPSRIKNGIIKLNGTLALHAAAINCRCLKKLIHKIETDKRWVDSVIGDLHSELKVYGFVKPLALQIKGYSDIQETYINYNTTLSSKLIFKIKYIIKSLLSSINKAVNQKPGKHPIK